MSGTARRFACDNCGYTGNTRFFKQIDDLLQLRERIDVGGIFTDRECPHCGSMAYPSPGRFVDRHQLVEDIKDYSGDDEITPPEPLKVELLAESVTKTGFSIRSHRRKTASVDVLIDYFDGICQLMVFQADQRHAGPPAIKVRLNKNITSVTEVMVARIIDEEPTNIIISHDTD